MAMTQTQARRCTIYRGGGSADELPIEPDPAERDPPLHPSPGDRASIRAIMTRDVLCARPDLAIGAVVNLMVGRRVGCLPVVDERRHPIGVITKFDLVEQLDEVMRLAGCGCPLPADLTVQTADDLMMPIALTLDEHASIEDAASMMTSEDTHHVLVIASDGALVGVVSAKDLAGWLAS